MSSFHDVSFPLPLAFGANGGPIRQTEIITLAIGQEQRNTAQANSRRRYDAGVGVKSLEDMQTLIAFFEARRGQLHGFRFRDPMDHKVDGEIGTGNFSYPKLMPMSLARGNETSQNPKPERLS